CCFSRTVRRFRGHCPDRAAGESAGPQLRQSAAQESEVPAAGHHRPAAVGYDEALTVSLGVRCTYCHVGEEGKPLSTFDFASDAKDHKLTARKMLAMMHRINAEDFYVKQFKDT